MELLEMIKSDWLIVNTKQTNEIIHRYAEAGRKISLSYFVKYYTPIIIHQCIGATIVISSGIATDSTYSVYAHHACGIFATVKHQLNNTPYFEKSVDNITTNKNKISEQLIDCIKRHKRAICITGVKTTLNLNHPSAALQAGVLCFGHFVHIYYYSWHSQKILDHSSTIFDAAYNTEWYTVLDKTTNLVRFMMLRSTKPCVQTAGRVFPMTLMNFTVVTIDEITNIICSRIPNEHVSDVRTDNRKCEQHLYIPFPILFINNNWNMLVIRAEKLVGLMLVRFVHSCKMATAGFHMMELFEMIKSDWLIVNTKQTNEIIHRYAETGRKISLSYVVTFTPRVLDILNPLNESRPFIYIFSPNYMVDPVKYYTPIIIHQCIGATIAISSIIATDSTYSVYAHHACGMFAAVRLQLNNTPYFEKSVDNIARNKNKISERLIDCIKRHKRAIWFSDTMESAHVGLMFVILLTGVLSLSITGVQTTLNLNHPSEALQAGVLCFGHFVHIYYYSWNSQKILDHSSTIFDAAYNTEWYTVLDKRTNLVSFMMLRSTKPCVQTAGKVFPMTLMNFTVMMELFNVIKENWQMISTNEQRIIMQNHAEKGRKISIITLVGLIAITSIITVDATYAVYANHACGMFVIVRNQLDNLVFLNESKNNSMANETNNFRKIVNCIEKHKRAIRFCDMIESAHVGLLFILLVTSVLSLSMTGVQTMRNLDSPLQALSYNAKWYAVLDKTSKLLTLVMLRSSKPCIQTAGKIFPLTYMNFTTMIELFNTIKDDWLIVKTEQTNKIIHRYAETGRKISLSYVTTDCSYCVYAHHACGMFATVKHQLNNTPYCEKSVDNITRNKNKISERLIDCIKRHKRAIWFSDTMESAHVGLMFVILLTGVLSLSITGVKATLNLNHPPEAFQAGVLCSAHMVHIYYYSWNSQKILDHSSTIFDAAYSTEWYTVLDKSTKLVSFMMLRSTKPCVQTAGKVFPMTLMNFTVVIGVIVYFNDKEVVLESITPFMIAILCTSKYINAILNVKTMTKLLNRLKEDWNIYTSEEEKRILNEYAHIGQLVIYGYMVVVYVTTAIFITEPLMPKWINIILDINETLPNKYPVPIYWYKIDMEANFYLILCYESICIVTILTITVANDALFIVFLQHACALFAVASIAKVIEQGRSAKSLEDDEIESYDDNIIQRTLSEWYKMSLNTQKLVILVTLRSQKPCKLTAGKIVLLSMETFGSLIKLGEERHNIDGIIECIPMIGLHSLTFGKYFNWIFNAKKMKNLFLHMKRDWDSLQFDEDIAITHRFCERGRVVNVLYSSTLFSILALYLASPSIPIILDKLNPLNETRNRIFLYQTEYFVDQNEYYIPILIHAYITVPISVSIPVFVDNMFAIYVHHACGMFATAVFQLHLEKIHEISVDKTKDKVVRSKKILQHIVLVVEMHSNALEFAKELESAGTLSYLIIFIINLSIITLCGIVTVMKLDQPSESIRFLAFTLGAIFHLFFSSFQGQRLIDESENVFYSAYMSEWYDIPVELQRLLVPIMARSATPCRVTAGLLYIISMDTFSVILGVITHFDDKQVVLESIAPFMIDIFCTAKYINAILNLKTMTKLLEHLKEDWAMYTSEEEKRILNSHAHTGQFVIYGYVVFVYLATVVFLTEPLLAKGINLILHSNETIENKYAVPINWGIINMERNYYPLYFYQLVCVITIITITVANDSMFIIFLQHACGLFAIVQYQLENLVHKNDLNNMWGHSRNYMRPDNIQHDFYMKCIKNHKRAIKFAKLLENMYVWCFGVVIGINMPLISVTALQLKTQSSTIQQMIKYSMFACAQMLHLFFDCYLSQQLTDKSSAIQEHITLSNWYKMPLKTQKLVIMVTLRSQKPCRLTAGKIIFLSMETFALIMKTAASYFTVLVSMG
ncbi:hypothetical protein PV325_011573 [Microctonus aethiopoides]|nr:hypothetical protein PV325_011573 [Microctonus aethiopoides]